MNNLSRDCVSCLTLTEKGENKSPFLLLPEKQNNPECPHIPGYFLFSRE
jgi:hypothetical protein